MLLGILGVLDILVIDTGHVDLLKLRAIVDKLIIMCRLVMAVVTRITAGKCDVLPGLGPQLFRGGVEHEEALVELEESHDTVGRRHGERDTPGHPVEIVGGARRVLYTQEGGNGKGTHRHGQTERVEESSIDAAAAAIFGHEESKSFLDRVALEEGEIIETIKDIIHVVRIFHRS